MMGIDDALIGVSVGPNGNDPLAPVADVDPLVTVPNCPTHSTIAAPILCDALMLNVMPVSVPSLVFVNKLLTPLAVDCVLTDHPEGAAGV